MGKRRALQKYGGEDGKNQCYENAHGVLQEECLCFTHWKFSRL